MADLQRSLDNFLAEKHNRWGLIALLVVAELILAAGIVFILFFHSSEVAGNLLSVISPATQTPAPACLQTTLQLGMTSFPVQVISGTQGGELALSAANGDQAYQVAGASAGYVFGLNPSPAALALQGSLHTGNGVRIIWPNCTMEDFIVQSVTAGAPDPAALLAMPDAVVRVFVPGGAGAAGFTILGIPPGALIASTPACNTPMLNIGAARYRIQEITPGADGSLAIPPEPADSAYHIAGSNAYALPPAAANLALSGALHAGDLVSLVAAGCAATDFHLEAPLPGAAFDPADPAPLVVYIHNAPEGQGFVVKGGPVVAEEIAIPTPGLADEGIQAEISLLEVTAPDPSTLSVRVSINNYGASAFTLTAGDNQLLPVNASPLPLNASDPALPLEIAPGATEVFYFTFPRPSAPGAVLRILSAEFDLEGF